MVFGVYVFLGLNCCGCFWIDFACFGLVITGFCFDFYGVVVCWCFVWLLICVVCLLGFCVIYDWVLWFDCVLLV